MLVKLYNDLYTAHVYTCSVRMLVKLYNDLYTAHVYTYSVRGLVKLYKDFPVDILRLKQWNYIFTLGISQLGQRCQRSLISNRKKKYIHPLQLFTVAL